jgi:crossover junction endodeoxyribonuclease RuvC
VGILTAQTLASVDGGEASALASPTPPLVVGIDLSLTTTGIAYPDCTTHLVESKGKLTDSLTQRRSRLCDIRWAVLDHCIKADLVVIESPAYSRTQGSQHDRSGLWWLIVDNLHMWGTPVAEVTPSGRAKYATGKGNAGKDEVIAAVVRRFPTFTGSNNNAADALVLCAMGLDHLGYPIADMPAVNRTALGAVRWPDMEGN